MDCFDIQKQVMIELKCVESEKFLVRAQEIYLSNIGIVFTFPATGTKAPLTTRIL